MSKRIRQKKKRSFRPSLTLVLSLFVFTVLVAAVGLASLLLYILTETGVLADAGGDPPLSTVILLLFAVSLVLGAVAAFFGSRIPLSPINALIDKMNRLAAGDFHARLYYGPTASSYRAFREIEESFNTMAKELENTEVLRVDFINNFSHEFKTPLSSIAGLAKLLRGRDLSREQQEQYLLAIEEESARLCAMASGILRLSRVENQSILTDLSPVNLAEQIRHALLLLEDRWTEKELELALELEEGATLCNEELLSEVFINLLDNAIKFSPRGGRLFVSARYSEGDVTVSVANGGEPIPADKLEKIFCKFYQADESHATVGNGIGLAIVKRVVELHGGHVQVTSDATATVFTVTLPS